jgi:hypothetical protein
LTEGVSPDLLKSRLAYVIKAVNLIKDQSQQAVSQVELKPNGEMQTRFFGYTFRVVFGAPSGELEGLKREAQRFTEILEKFKRNPEVIDQIDLAFDKRAVVKLVR